MRVGLCLVLMLAGCATAPTVAPLDVPPLPALDSALARPCQRPTPIPGSVTSSDVDPLWAADRLAMTDCAAKVDALIARDARLGRALQPD